MTLFCHLVIPTELLQIVSDFFFFTPCLVSGFLLQAHGSGGPEKLNFLAESECGCHSDCRAGLCHVQSTSQTAVIWQLLPPSVSLLTLFSPLTWKTKKNKKKTTDQPTRCIAQNPSHPVPTVQHGKNLMVKTIGTFYIHLKIKFFVYWPKGTVIFETLLSLPQSICKHKHSVALL